MAIVKLTPEQIQSLQPKQLNPTTGVLRGAADVGVNVLKGTLLGGKMLSDAVDANNSVSDVIQSGIDGLDGLISQGAKDQEIINAARTRNAEGKGAAAEIAAALKNFSQSPLDTVAQGAGTIAPALLAQRLGGGAAAKQAISTGIGGAMGAGAVKGEIYDAVRQAHIDAGKSEEEADALASAAQSYTGDNLDQIGLGAGLGVLAGGTGVEAVAARLAAQQVGKEAGQSLLKKTLIGGATEAVPEAIQGGQERVAANLAQQREGFDMPTWQGVAGQATLEGLAAAPLGGAFSAAEALAKPADPMQQARNNLQQTLQQAGGGGAITTAAQTAVATGAADGAIVATEALKTNLTGLNDDTEQTDAATGLADGGGQTTGSDGAGGAATGGVQGQDTGSPLAGAGQAGAVLQRTGWGNTLGATLLGQPINAGQPFDASTIVGGTQQQPAAASSNNPFTGTADDLLPKLRGMTTDPTVIKQIDEEIARRGLAVADKVVSTSRAGDLTHTIVEKADGTFEARVDNGDGTFESLPAKTKNEADGILSKRLYEKSGLAEKDSAAGKTTGSGGGTIAEPEPAAPSAESDFEKQQAEQFVEKAAEEDQKFQKPESKQDQEQQPASGQSATPADTPADGTKSTSDGVIARVGMTPKSARPVTVRDGVIYVGDEPAYDYENGEPVKATGTDFASVKKALVDAGAISTKEKVFVPAVGSKAKPEEKTTGTGGGTIAEPEPETAAKKDDGLDGIEVDVPAITKDGKPALDKDGKQKTGKMKASDALNEVNQRIEKLLQLKDCVSS